MRRIMRHAKMDRGIIIIRKKVKNCWSPPGARLGEFESVLPSVDPYEPPCPKLVLSEGIMLSS